MTLSASVIDAFWSFAPWLLAAQPSSVTERSSMFKLGSYVGWLIGNFGLYFLALALLVGLVWLWLSKRK